MSGIIGGLIGGVSGIIFVWLLTLAQQVRVHFPFLIFTLPLFGFLIPSLRGATQLILGSFLTHLGGGSAGREGAIVQLSKWLALKWDERSPHLRYFPKIPTKDLILVSMGAGFGAALGAPLAGIIFGFEFNRASLLKPKTFFHAAIASFVALFLVDLAKIQHFRLPPFEIPGLQIRILAMVLLVSILMGFATTFFHFLRHQVERFAHRLNPRLAGVLGGMVLLLIFFFFPLNAYQGLGFETIEKSAQQVLEPQTSLIKLILTAITLGSGFQGGEFVPLAFIGSTLGSAFSFVDSSTTALLAALGFVTLYAASTQTAYTGILLACELFSWKIFPFAALSVFIATRIHGRISVTSND